MSSNTDSIDDDDIVLRSDTLAILNEVFLAQTNNKNSETISEDWQVFLFLLYYFF